MEAPPKIISDCLIVLSGLCPVCQAESEGTAPSLKQKLIPGAFGKHDLRGLVEISPPVSPLVTTGTQHPEIPDPVLIKERHHLLTI